LDARDVRVFRCIRSTVDVLCLGTIAVGGGRPVQLVALPAIIPRNRFHGAGLKLRQLRLAGG